MNANQRLFWLGIIVPWILLLTASCAAVPPAPASGAATGEKIIGYGAEVNLKDHLVSGKTVIFDFFSEYCPPCRRISPLLAKLDDKRHDLVVIKVDINRKGVTGIDWGSPVARQYNLQGIPYFKIYSPDGKLSAEGDAAYEQVLGLLDKEGIK
jgi:thiol-disulfide isomerase/thioredoxin